MAITEDIKYKLLMGFNPLQVRNIYHLRLRPILSETNLIWLFGMKSCDLLNHIIHIQKINYPAYNTAVNTSRPLCMYICWLGRHIYNATCMLYIDVCCHIPHPHARVIVQLLENGDDLFTTDRTEMSFILQLSWYFKLIRSAHRFCYSNGIEMCLIKSNLRQTSLV